MYLSSFLLLFVFYYKCGSLVVVDKLLILQECYDECSFGYLFTGYLLINLSRC